MVKLEGFEIQFDNADSVYFAGQEMGGTLAITIAEEKKINEILLELKGKAKTHWTKHSGSARKHFTESEPYFCEQFNTEYTHSYGKHKERVLPAGKHLVPFCFPLPKNLPSSFEGEHGQIRYTIRAILERPWDYDIIAKRAFSVVGIEDMNEDTQAREMIKLDRSDFEIKFCCQRQGSVAVNLCVPKSGYTPGEAIPISATIQNDSNKTLRFSAARVKQHTMYKAKAFSGHEQTKEVSKTVASTEKGAIGPHSKFTWTNEPLVIPPLPPILFRCKIIDIAYTLEFEVDPGITVLSPLRIGTIPLIEVTEKQIKELGKVARGAKSIRPNLAIPESSSSLVPRSLDGVSVTITDADGLTEPEVGGGPESPKPKRRVRLPSSVLSELYPAIPSPIFKTSTLGEVTIFEEKEAVHYGEPKFAPKYPVYNIPMKTFPPNVT